MIVILLIMIVFLLFIVVGYTMVIYNNEEEIRMKLSEVADALKDIDVKLDEASVRIVTKITDLQNMLQDVDVPEAVTVAIDELKADAIAIGGIVPLA